MSLFVMMFAVVFLDGIILVWGIYFFSGAGGELAVYKCEDPVQLCT